MKPLITRLGKLFITCPITVYPYDVDFMQIVNNITYLRWFENLRVHLVEKFFPLVEMVEQKCAPILSESRIKYLKPVLLSSSPMGSARMTSLTPSRWTIELEIYEKDTLFWGQRIFPVGGGVIKNIVLSLHHGTYKTTSRDPTGRTNRQL